MLHDLISTNEDPSLRIESSAIINLRGVSTKLNKYFTILIVNFSSADELQQVQQRVDEVSEARILARQTSR